MADSASLGKEFWSELFAQGAVKAFTKFAGALLENFVSGSSSQITEHAQRYVFGNKETDEQIFKLALAHAVTKGYISPAQRDGYLFALKKLPSQRQNDYRLYVIQTWDEKAEAEEIIERAAQVIKHDAELVETNEPAWLASAEIFDLSQPLLPPDIDISKMAEELRQKHERYESFNQFANWAMAATFAACLVGVLVTFFMF